MTNLYNKVFEFRRHFNISDFALDQEFRLDEEGNLLAKWKDNYYYLTNKRDPKKLLSKATVQYKLKYGIEFLRALKIVPPKKLKPKKEATIIPLKEQVSAFKKFHIIPKSSKIPELKLVDKRLFAKWNEKWIPISQRKNY